MKDIISFIGWFFIGFVLWQAIGILGFGILSVLLSPPGLCLLGFLGFAWIGANIK